MENNTKEFEKLDDSSLEEVAGGRGFDDLVARGNQAWSSALEFRGKTGGVRFLGRTWVFPWSKRASGFGRGRSGGNGSSSSEATVDL